MTYTFDHWAKLPVQMGRPVPTVDRLLAATALHHEKHIVMRHPKIDLTGLEVINSWG